jgi:methylenetetrahydrofolate dehydrogenase (NADP+) / methenyltetrahydrofolate cyclohydrolase
VYVRYDTTEGTPNRNALVGEYPMTAIRLDGQQLAQTIRAEITQEVKGLVTQGKQPGLAVVLVGENPASQVYVRNKKKACEEVGMKGWQHNLPATVSQAELLDLVTKLNADPQVHGILVQLPLPKQIREEAIVLAIDPMKDVDAFHPQNLGLLTVGHPRYLPCTPFGVQQLLVRNQIETSGKHIVILGRSNIVGKPLALILMQKRSSHFPQAGDATVTIAHSRSHDLKKITQEADILIAAVGQPRFVTGEMIKPGTVVIDVGIHSIDGKIVGDVDALSVEPIAGALSPVPKGVGPMTITMLLQNTLQAARIQE